MTCKLKMDLFLVRGGVLFMTSNQTISYFKNVGKPQYSNIFCLIFSGRGVRIIFLSLVYN